MNTVMQNVTEGKIIEGMKLHEIQDFDVDKTEEIARLYCSWKEAIIRYNEIAQFAKKTIINDAGCNIHKATLDIKTGFGTIEVNLDEVIAFEVLYRQLELLSEKINSLKESIDRIHSSGFNVNRTRNISED